MDRIARAWLLRSELHGFIAAHPGSSMAAIAAAFSGRNLVTLRKAVRRLCRDGDVEMRGGSTAARYHARASQPTAECTVRDKLRESGRKSHALHLRDRFPRSPPVVFMRPPLDPWSTVHVSSGPCIRSHGGQGTRMVWRGGVSSLGG
ncbi:hypothetical protein ABW22_15705 [Thiobacillus denitrificans]|uniref:Uncharacterized protein n=2 Tax=Thiobacillus denitrificans TaxID=36861 RepID=A0A119CTV8_THIDE|nr:hypothetical protein ABW22_15705 [Thiobacillus denitrificans]